MKKHVLLIIISLFSLSLSAQAILRGMVSDASGSPMAFANISYEKSGIVGGVVSDLDGKYRALVAPGVYQVTFAMVGYTSVTIDSVVIKIGKSTMLDAVLEEGVAIADVVVTSKKYSAPLIESDGKDAQVFTSDAIESVPLELVEEEIAVESPRTRRPPPPPPKEKMTAKMVGRKDMVSRTAVKTEKVVSRTEVVFDDETIDVEKVAQKAGTLTAGEVNDFSKWTLWGDKSQESLRAFKTQWWIYPSKRFSVLIQNQDGFAVVDHEVVLMNSNQEKVWIARTDNLGRAELWANMFDDKKWGNGTFSILAQADGQSYTVNKATLFNDGVNQLTINKVCDVSDIVDVAFVVDATGSMSDEINYLKAELKDVIERVQEDHEALKIRLGSVFYRDNGEAYLTRKSEFSTDISKTIDFIKNQSAAGGGDTPEAVEVALEEAINNLNWSSHARTKLLFLVLDAPPHTHGDVLRKLNKIIIDAAAKGIRIIPITGSGIDKNTEYLMRCLSLSTNGTYVFLTDHSGVGGLHIKPTTDSYNVETLNDLLVRLFDQFTEVVSCEKKEEASTLEKVVKIDGLVKSGESKKFSCKFYPNPTYGQLKIKIKGDIKSLFLTDSSGRILERYNVAGRRKFKVDLSDYPAGVYQISYWGENKRAVSGRVVLIRD